MPETRQTASTVRFEAYELDLRAGELRKQGVKIKLAGRPIEILAMLLERPGEVLTREEMRNRLWSADTFVDFEHGLNSAIRKLRSALEDSAEKPRFIETLARRGYRFIGTVEKAERSEAPPAEPPASAWVGKIATLDDGSESHFLLVPVDEGTLREKEELEAAHDDLGMSLLTASEKLLLVSRGTKVRILEARPTSSSCLVRILEGQFIGQTAFVPCKSVRDLP